jgi:hypothetical protein
MEMFKILPTTSSARVNAVLERSSHSDEHRWRYRSTSIQEFKNFKNHCDPDQKRLRNYFN